MPHNRIASDRYYLPLIEMINQKKSAQIEYSILHTELVRYFIPITKKLGEERKFEEFISVYLGGNSVSQSIAVEKLNTIFQRLNQVMYSQYQINNIKTYFLRKLNYTVLRPKCSLPVNIIFAIITFLKQQQLSNACDLDSWLLKNSSLTKLHTLLEGNYVERKELTSTFNKPQFLQKKVFDPLFSPFLIRWLHHHFHANPIPPAITFDRKAISESAVPEVYFHYSINQMVKRAQHVLGLDTSPSSTLFVQGKGDNIGFTQHLLVKKLDAFLASSLFQYGMNRRLKWNYFEVRNALSVANDLIENSRYKQNAEKAFLNRYKEGKLVFFHGGWYKHSIGIVFYRGFVVICNRGEGGHPTHGTRIYALKSERALNEWFFKRMINKLQASKTEVLALLEEVVSFQRTIAFLPSKPQEHSTCAFANPKAIIEAMLCLIEAREDVNHPFGAASIQMAVSNAYQNKRKNYKIFTKFIREDEIKYILSHFDTKDFYPGSERFLLDLVREILIRHHGQGSEDLNKEIDELERGKMLIEGLPRHLFNHLQKDPNPDVQRALSAIQEIEHIPPVRKMMPQFQQFSKLSTLPTILEEEAETPLKQHSSPGREGW